MRVRRPFSAMIESPMPAYMIGVAIGMGCGALAVLLLPGLA